jgi:hypothetical protein
LPEYKTGHHKNKNTTDALYHNFNLKIFWAISMAMTISMAILISMAISMSIKKNENLNCF